MQSLVRRLEGRSTRRPQRAALLALVVLFSSALAPTVRAEGPSPRDTRTGRPSPARALGYYARAKVHQARAWLGEQRMGRAVAEDQATAKRERLSVDAPVGVYSPHRRQQEVLLKLAGRALGGGGKATEALKAHVEGEAQQAGTSVSRSFDRLIRRQSRSGYAVKAVTQHREDGSRIIFNASATDSPAARFGTLVHEDRHVDDRLHRDALKAGARPGDPRVTRELRALRLNSEVNAFGSEAYALGRSGRPLGYLWIGPTANMNGYRPARINRALARQYISGVWAALQPELGRATPEQRRLVSEYLRGYREALSAQGKKAATPRPAQKDPSAKPQQPAAPSTLQQVGLALFVGAWTATRAVNKVRGRIDASTRQLHSPVEAYEAGARDQKRGIQPHLRAATILAQAR